MYRYLENDDLARQFWLWDLLPVSTVVLPNEASFVIFLSFPTGVTGTNQRPTRSFGLPSSLGE
jgi:hypothetical protein